MNPVHFHYLGDQITELWWTTTKIWAMLTGAFVLLLMTQLWIWRIRRRQEELNGVFMRQLIELTGFRDDCRKGIAPIDAGKE